MLITEQVDILAERVGVMRDERDDTSVLNEVLNHIGKVQSDAYRDQAMLTELFDLVLGEDRDTTTRAEAFAMTRDRVRSLLNEPNHAAREQWVVTGGMSEWDGELVDHWLHERGARRVNAVTRDTTGVIEGDRPSPGKIERARAFNVPIVPVAQIAESQGRVAALTMSDRLARDPVSIPAGRQTLIDKQPSPKTLVQRFAAAVDDKNHPYHALAWPLLDAYQQAAEGKGKERHANDLPFAQQHMQTIARGQGHVGGIIFQACKKAQEAERMDRTAAVHELAGAIVYLAGGVVFLRDNREG